MRRKLKTSLVPKFSQISSQMLTRHGLAMPTGAKIKSSANKGYMFKANAHLLPHTISSIHFLRHTTFHLGTSFRRKCTISVIKCAVLYNVA